MLDNGYKSINLNVVYLNWAQTIMIHNYIHNPIVDDLVKNWSNRYDLKGGDTFSFKLNIMIDFFAFLNENVLKE